MYLKLKLIFIVSFLCGVVLDTYAVEEKIEYNLSLDAKAIHIDTLHVNDIPFTALSIDNLNNFCEDNEPTLPVKYVSFRLPTYCNKLSANILSSSCLESVKIAYPILPGLNIPSKENGINEINYATTGERYLNSIIEPTVDVCNEYFVNGSDHIVTLAICPVGYNHLSKELNFFTNIKVELNYSLCGESEMEVAPLLSEGETNILDLNELVENNGTMEKIGNFIDNNVSKPIKSYVIIVPDNLKDAVEKLSNWKKQKGYSVIVQTVEDILKSSKFKIGANQNCFDKESSVREWLKDRYKNSGAFFCLFIGDYRTSAPIRKFNISSRLTDVNSHKYTPTDAYFSDLISQWDLQKDPSGIYSCSVYSASFSPTIPVGRLLCASREEIERYTNKLILYEMFPGRGDTGYLANGFLLQSIDAIRWKSKSMFEYLSHLKTDTLQDNNSEHMADLRPLAKDVIASMNRCGIVSWQGHGTPISIACATIKNQKNKWPTHRFILAQTKYREFHDRFSADNMNGLDYMGNENYPSVAYSLSCTIAPFDDLREEYGYDNQYNMASAFTVAGEYGGPAMLANTRDGHFTSSGDMENEFGKHLQTNSCIGIAEMYSKLTVPNPNDGSVKEILFGHNIIGDPEFNIWTSAPQFFSGNATLDSGTLTIKSNSLKRGFYGIHIGNNGFQSEYITTNKSLSISFSGMFNSSTASQIATLYIWQNNFLPYIQIITTGKEIIDTNQEIMITNALFSESAKTLGAQPVCPIDKLPSYLNIGSNSHIKIEALNKIASNSGIIVHKKGFLSLKGENIVLKGDKVEEGGTMNVVSNLITLNPGFTVEAGANAIFSPY